MAFTMHSHSGEFCPGHATDKLEDIVLHGIKIGMTTMGLTEHMPRLALSDLYPEELDDPEKSLAELLPRHHAFIAEASRLRAKYAGQIHLLVGFEGEWLRGADYVPFARALAADPAVDYFVGSLHHVRGVPIDLEPATYARAVAAAEGTVDADQPGGGPRGEEALFAAYYDEQHAMIAALRPRVVGHFDLVRLRSADPAARDIAAAWPRVWARVRRNLAAVAAHGGLIECNSSALRKGLAEPYPARAIAEAWLALGGRFTLSDDSHGVAQVATNYGRTLDYLQSLGVEEVWALERRAGAGKEAKAEVVERSVSLATIRGTLRI